MIAILIGVPILLVRTIDWSSWKQLVAVIAGCVAGMAIVVLLSLRERSRQRSSLQPGPLFAAATAVIGAIVGALTETMQVTALALIFGIVIALSVRGVMTLTRNRRLSICDRRA